MVILCKKKEKLFNVPTFLCDPSPKAALDTNINSERGAIRALQCTVSPCSVLHMAPTTPSSLRPPVS